MADYINPDKAAHALFDFKPEKVCDYENGRYEVFYHEKRLYSVRDKEKNTLTLIEAPNPDCAYSLARDKSRVTNISGSVVKINL